MAPTVFFIVFLLVILMVIAVWASIVRGPGGIEAWRVRRRHRRMAPTPIAELPENALGRMVGRVAASEQALRAPLTDRPCVYYMVVVSERRGKRRVTRATERRGVSFVIADRSGRAIVDSTNAQLASTFDYTERIGWFSCATPEQEALLTRHGLRSKGLIWTRSFRFYEAVIAIGDQVGVIGAGVHEADVAAPVELGYRTAPPTRLRITNSAAAPLSILCGPQP